MRERANAEGVSLFMAAIDGGYCTLKKDDQLTIDFASSKALKLTGEDTKIHLTDFMSEADKKEFFKAYKNIGIFSVKCNLIIDNKLVPTTLKCNSTDKLIYCDITIQADWFNYAARLLQEKLEYERLISYSKTYLFAVDLKWNFINYTANFRDLLDLHELDRNLQAVLTDSSRVHPECESAIERIFQLNTMYNNDAVEYLKIKDKVSKKWETYRLELKVIFNRKNNYAEYIVGSFVDVKAEMLTVEDSGKLRDKETGVFTKAFLSTNKYTEILTGKTYAAYMKIETSEDLYETQGYKVGEEYFQGLFKKIAKVCETREVIAIRMNNNECFIVQSISDRDKIKECLMKINSTVKQNAAEYRLRSAITCGVVQRINNMDDANKLLDDAYYTYKQAKKKGLGKVIFNVE